MLTKYDLHICRLYDSVYIKPIEDYIVSDKVLEGMIR